MLLFLLFIVITLLNWYFAKFKKVFILVLVDLLISIIGYILFFCLDIHDYINTNSGGGFISPRGAFDIQWFIMNIALILGVFTATIKAKKYFSNKQIIALIFSMIFIIVINLCIIPQKVEFLYNEWLSNYVKDRYVKDRFGNSLSKNKSKVLTINEIKESIVYEKDLRAFKEENIEGYNAIAAGLDIEYKTSHEDTGGQVLIGLMPNLDTGENEKVFFQDTKQFFIWKEINKYTVVNVNDYLPDDFKTKVIREYPGNVRISSGVDKEAKDEHEIVVVMCPSDKDSMDWSNYFYFKPVIKNGKIKFQEISRDRIELNYYMAW